ncbi:MAG: DUF2939 domain-containing protein [Candidatus Moranbacteria bacterium]|nr:DUF2939 domain-containing protein [Candidatus Moranbacteria bacterium]
MAKKIIIGLVAIAVILGGTFYYFKGTPKYSLYQLKKAIASHDSSKFNQYVDVDRVVQNLMDTAVKEFDEEMAEDDNPFGDFGKGIMQAMMPSLKEGLKNSINQGIEEISENKDNKYSKIEIQEIIKEGKSANITLINQDNETIKLNMIQMPERYWRIVGINFDDFKKISPESVKASDDSEEEKEEEVVIEKNISDEVELATIKFKINSAEEKQSVSGSFGGPKVASEGTKFVVLDITVTNITKEGFDFDSDGIEVTDEQGRKFESWDDTIGNVANYLEMRELQPSIPETGAVVYELPSDANSYSLSIGKQGTSEVYKIKIK